MPITICSKCRKPVPDSIHDFKEECECMDCLPRAKKNGWIIKSKGVTYDFSKEIKK